jgi:hypothetical protein
VIIDCCRILSPIQLDEAARIVIGMPPARKAAWAELL